MPELSVIIPVYGTEKTLNRCVRSVVNQTMRDIEIILVDDGSPDNCPALCDEWAKKDGRIKVVHKTNGGLGFARNSGMAVATGKYLTFIDSDDYIDEIAYERVFADAHGDEDAIRFFYLRENENGEELTAEKVSPLKAGAYFEKDIKEKILFPLFGMLPSDDGKAYVSSSTCCQIYRTEILKNGGFEFQSERRFISEDLLFNVRFMATAKKILVLEDKFYHYTVNGSSLTQSYRKDRFARFIEVCDELKKLSVDYGVSDEVSLRIDRTLASYARRCVKLEFLTNPDKKAVKKNVKEICRSSALEEVFERYPAHKLPFKYRVSFGLLKSGNVFLLRLFKNKL